MSAILYFIFLSIGISPHERLQVSNRFSNDKRLHTKNVPRWSFKHTRNFKLIVQANKVDSTFIKKASIINKKVKNKAVLNNTNSRDSSQSFSS